jgi:uncharacterized protein YbbC (DUF1343 family)
MAGCAAHGQQKGFFDEDQPAETVVKTGLEVLIEQDFAPLKGKRVGLVTNPSGVDRNLVSTIDILADAPEVNLVALYGPEHGVRGSEHAGDHVTSEPRDPATGLPVYSLYGATRKPTPEMLKGIDVMVYDIQDNGTRSYTFISTLGLVMTACAEAGIEVMVLDRPNPLGGIQMDGPLVQDGYFSFVGMYRIPYVYGLTVGELATMVNEEGMNRGQKGNEKPLKCKLKVIEMEGWRRDMLFTDTGLPWVMPSPHIPQASSAMAYPCSGIAGDMGGYVNIGVGYTLPFELFGAEWIKDPEGLAARLNGLGLTGVRFRPIYYKPFYGGSAGKLVKGVQFYFTDYHHAPTALLQFYVLQEIHAMYPTHKPSLYDDSKFAMLDKITGGPQVRHLFSKRCRVEDILDYWNADRDTYRVLAEKYFRY